MTKRKRRFAAGALALAALAIAATVASAFPPGAPTSTVVGAEPSLQGPSSSQAPYIIRTQPGLITESLLTTGDSVNLKPDGVTPYRMVGIPDGLGAFDNGDGTFTLLMNHELPNTSGIVRAHGSTGAFVSKWTIDKSTLEVLNGQDLDTIVQLWNGTAFAPGTTQFNRFCSADLPALSAFWNAATGKGFNGRLLMNGEENADGRAFAHELNGTAWQLPAFGRLAYENSLANPASGDTTAVVSTDDTSPLGQVYVYVGQKQTAGSPIDKAGLTGGTVFGITVAGLLNETNATTVAPGTRFSLTNLGNRTADTTGAQLDTASNAAGVTRFLRPEDGSWDPSNARNFYFVTTNAFGSPSRLWKLVFDNPANPAAGGTVEIVLDGTEGQQMLDNMTVAENGDVLLVEDVGNNSRLGKAWRYNVTTDTLVEFARHDAGRFLTGSPDFLTQDEENSGIIPAPFLGKETYLLDTQAHFGNGAELVEGGQLQLVQWMDYDNLGSLVSRLVADKDAKGLLHKLDEAQKEQSKGKTVQANKKLDEFQKELAHLTGEGKVSWKDSALLAQLADEIRP
jgi:Bacterial protein of unknown function (DUF839)